MNNGTDQQMEQLKQVIRNVLAEFSGNDERFREVREIFEIKPGEQRVLDALNWLEHVTGRDAFAPQLVAYFARQQAEHQSYQTVRRDLRRKGFLQNTYAGWMQLTASGRAHSKTEMHVTPKKVKVEQHEPA